MKTKNRALQSIAALAICIVLIMLTLSSPLQGQGSDQENQQATQQAQALATQEAQAEATQQVQLTQWAQATQQAEATQWAQATQHAQEQSSQSSCTGITNFTWDHTDGNTGDWLFSWVIVANMSGNPEFQYKGGGVTDVWLTLSYQFSRRGMRDYAQITPINFTQGQWIYFRIKINTSDGNTLCGKFEMNSSP